MQYCSAGQPESDDRLSTVAKITVGSNNVTYPGWLKTEKTTGGWPFLENDIYVTISATSPGHAVYSGDAWELEYTGFVLSSSRAKGGLDPTHALRSQSFAIVQNRNCTSGFFTSNIGFGSWPHGGEGNFSSYNGSPLYLATTNLSEVTATKANDTAGFPLNGSALFTALRGAYDQDNYDGDQKHMLWSYSAWPWGDKTDCGHMYFFLQLIPPGETVEFDLVDITDWGIFDQSRAVLSFKVTVPPSPDNMTAEELEMYGIVKRTYPASANITQYETSNVTFFVN